MALAYVGGVTGTGSNASFSLDLTALTGGVDTQAREGDLVVVATVNSSTSNIDPGVSTSGFSELVDLYANDSSDANLSINYKALGSSPDTTVTCNGSGSSGYGSVAAAHVWRNFDPATPFDVSLQSATGINSAVADAPAITPVTTGAVVVAIGGNARAASTALNSLSGYENNLYANTDPGTSAGVAIGSKVWSGSGAENPPAWGWLSDSTAGSWCAATLAIRPATNSDQAVVTNAQAISVPNPAVTVLAVRQTSITPNTQDFSAGNPAVTVIAEAGGSATPESVQTKITNGGGYVNALDVTLDQATTEGNFLIVAIGHNAGNSIASLSDNLGNVYTKLLEDDGEYRRLEIWYAEDIAVGSTTLSLATGGGAYLDIVIAVREFSGLDPTDPIDLAEIGSDNGYTQAQVSPASGVPNQATSLVFGASVVSANTTFSAGSGYGNLAQANGFDLYSALGIEDKVITSASSETVAFATPNDVQHVTAVVILKPATSGGGVTITADPEAIGVTSGVVAVSATRSVVVAVAAQAIATGAPGVTAAGQQTVVIVTDAETVATGSPATTITTTANAAISEAASSLSVASPSVVLTTTRAATVASAAHAVEIGNPAPQVSTEVVVATDAQEIFAISPNAVAATRQNTVVTAQAVPITTASPAVTVTTTRSTQIAVANQALVLASSSANVTTQAATIVPIAAQGIGIGNASVQVESEASVDYAAQVSVLGIGSPSVTLATAQAVTLATEAGFLVIASPVASVRESARVVPLPGLIGMDGPSVAVWGDALVALTALAIGIGLPESAVIVAQGQYQRGEDRFHSAGRRDNRPLAPRYNRR